MAHTGGNGLKLKHYQEWQLAGLGKVNPIPGILHYKRPPLGNSQVQIDSCLL